MPVDWKPGDDIFLLLDDKTGEERDITVVFEALIKTANEHDFDMNAYGGKGSLTRHALYELWWKIEKGWPMSKKSYPRLNGPEDHHALVHAVLHLVKSTGKVTAAVEPYDHGKDVDQVALRKQLGYTLVNLLRVASLAKIMPGDLLTEVDGWLAENPWHGGVTDDDSPTEGSTVL